MIDLTNVDMVKFVQKVYELSGPQGMGMFLFQPGGLSDEEAKAFIQKDGSISMDYVKGRACKMHVRLDGDKLGMSDSWYDHTDSQLNELLAHIGVQGSGKKEHGCACNCNDCQGEQ